MGEYVGLVKGKVHDRREISEYYCGGCGYPVTDHDSYCRECGGSLHEGIDNSCWYELSCGHSLTLKGSELPNYCPICGNKTIVT